MIDPSSTASEGNENEEEREEGDLQEVEEERKERHGQWGISTGDGKLTCLNFVLIVIRLPT